MKNITKPKTPSKVDELNAGNFGFYRCAGIRQFSVPALFGGGSELVTAKQKIAALLDDSWLYSAHWPEDNAAWLEQVKTDIRLARGQALKRLDEIKQAERILCSFAEKSDGKA